MDLYRPLMAEFSKQRKNIQGAQIHPPKAGKTGEDNRLPISNWYTCYGQIRLETIRYIPGERYLCSIAFLEDFRQFRYQK